MSKKKQTDNKAENKEPTVKAENAAEETEVKAESPENPEKESTAKEISAEEKLQEELKNQKESYLRLAAEYDNYRRRTQAEKLSIYDDATAKAVQELLPIADSMDMAMQNMQDAPEEFSKGMELINNQLNSAFSKLKIEEFGKQGDAFNPELHNAVSKIDSEDFGENEISQVFQKGYKLNDKIVRHAMVQVAN